MSRSDKFYAEYSNIHENLKHQFIPTKEVYDEMFWFFEHKPRIKNKDDTNG